MAGSGEKYYEEKMQRLLEMQAAASQLPPPIPRRDPTRQAKKNTAVEKTSSRETKDRWYYDSFRARMADQPTAAQKAARSGAARQPQTVRNSQTAHSASARRSTSGGEQNGAGTQAPHIRPAARSQTGQASRKTVAGASGQQNAGRRAPQQTWEDKQFEEQRRVEAYRHAARGRRLRKLREGLISFVLILGVFAVLCAVVYRLLFVVGAIDAQGISSYTADEIVAASGVATGDHLYSFSARATAQKIKLRCPYVNAVDVQRTPPGTIVFSVEEEAPMYFAEFYGELWELSPTLRMLNPISLEDAQNAGLIRLKLPAVQSAVSGEQVEFGNLKNQNYMTEVLSAMVSSDLSGRIGMVDLRSPYNIMMSCDGKYKLIFGDSNAISTKFRLASAVLADEIFEGDNKAQIDLTDLSATSVIIDNQLVIE